MVVDSGDAAGVVNVGEGVGGEDDEVGGVAGGDEADVEGGVERVDELARAMRPARRVMSTCSRAGAPVPSMRVALRRMVGC